MERQKEEEKRSRTVNFYLMKAKTDGRRVRLTLSWLQPPDEEEDEQNSSGFGLTCETEDVLMLLKPSSGEAAHRRGNDCS